MGCTGYVIFCLLCCKMALEKKKNLNKKYGCIVPLLLMNSFNIHDNTQKAPDPYLFVLLCVLSLLDFTCIVTPVVQLRLLRSTQTQILRFTPLIRYPPEHGGVFPSLKNSGKLGALFSWVDAMMLLLLYPCDIQEYFVLFWYFCSYVLCISLSPCRVKSMCLLPTS